MECGRIIRRGEDTHEVIIKTILGDEENRKRVLGNDYNNGCVTIYICASCWR